MHLSLWTARLHAFLQLLLLLSSHLCHTVFGKWGVFSVECHTAHSIVFLIRLCHKRLTDGRDYQMYVTVDLCLGREIEGILQYVFTVDEK